MNFLFNLNECRHNVPLDRCNILDNITTTTRSIYKKATVDKKKGSGQVSPKGTRVSKGTLTGQLTPLQKDIAEALKFSRKSN